MVNNVNGINVGCNNQAQNKKEPPYAELFKEHGVSPQEIKQYLDSKGINNPQQLQEALQSGDNPFNDLFAAKGISTEEVQAYEQKNGKPGQNESSNASQPPPPPPGGHGGPPPEILQELQKYGLQPQGSLAADKAAIASAKAQQSQQNGNNGYQTNFLSQQTIQGFKANNNLS